MAPSVLRQELVKLVADRLGLGEQLVNDALRGRQPAAGPAVGAARSRRLARRPRRRAPRRRSRPVPRSRLRHRPSRSTRAPRSPAASRARPRSSRTASRCPTTGRRGSAEVDVDDYFSAPATRKAAAYLRGRLRTPTANLPAGDDEFARLIAELVVRSGALEATPAKLELEALQLDLHRLERHISSARVTGASGVTRARRGAPEGARRDPPPADLNPSGTRTSVRVVMDRADASKPSSPKAARSSRSPARPAAPPRPSAYWVNKHGADVPARATPRRARRHRARAAPGARRGRSVDPSDRGALRRQRHHGAPLAAATRAQDAAGAVRAARRPRPAELLRECARHGWGPFVRVGAAGTYRCARCNTEAVSDRRRRVKEILVAGSGRSLRDLRVRLRTSARCNFITAIRRRKSFEVSRQGITRSLERLRLEARKCVLLCANCHAMVEAGLLNLPSGADNRG